MRSFTVTLPDDMVEKIEAGVAAGEYASASDLVRDGLEGSPAEDSDIDVWLRDVIVPRCRVRAMGSVLPAAAEDIMDRIQRRFAAEDR